MKTWLALSGILAVVVGVTVVAQQPQALPADGSLAALTAEVRLLRAAVEKSAQAQTQIQGLGVYLSAQQNRLIQVSGRVDAVRRDLDVAVRQVQEGNARVTQFREALARPLPPQEREAIEDALSAITAELQRASAAESQLRLRESEASSELQTELARWSDLIARLEQAIRQ